MGQLHVLHVAHEVALAGRPAEAPIEGLLLRHRGDRAARVVVAGVEQARIRKREDLLGDRGPEGVGVALLEVAAATAAHQQGIPGEGDRLVVQHVAQAAIGVAGCAAHLHMSAAEAHPIAVVQWLGDVLGAGGGGQGDRRTGGLVHQPAAGDVVGVGVGVEAGHQVDAQFADQGVIALMLLEHRIDQHPFAGGHIGQQIGEGAGGGVEQLAEEQGATASGGGEQGVMDRGGHTGLLIIV